MYRNLTIFGTQIKMYKIFNGLAYLFLLWLVLKLVSEERSELGFWAKKFKRPPIKTGKKKKKVYRTLTQTEGFWVAFEGIVISLVYWLGMAMNVPVGKLVNTGINYFGQLLFMPFLLVGIGFLLGRDCLGNLDRFTVAYPLALFVSKIGCFFDGCCAGIETSFGLYNYQYSACMFPVQLVEAGLAIGIFCFLLIYQKRAARGTVYPIYMIFFCGTRFFSEFLRIEPNVLGIFKTYHILCLMGLILGIIYYVLMKKYGSNLDAWLRKKQAGYLSHYHEKSKKR